MNKKTIIILTILATSLVLIGGFLIYHYEISRNEMYYNAGYANGLFYTQQTGDIIFLINGSTVELTMPDEWKAQIQQYLNQQGGN